MERVDLGETPYEAAAVAMAKWVRERQEVSTFTACSLPGVTMTSIAELAGEAGRAAPTEAEVRDAVWRAVRTAGSRLLRSRRRRRMLP